MILHVIHRALCRCVGVSGLADRLLSYDAARKLYILAYHRVNAPSLTYGPCVSPENFDAHMGYVASRFSVMRLCDIVDRVNAGVPLPPKVLAVTFDDGYSDVAEKAAPILERHGASASVYVTGSVAGSTDVLWTDRVEHAVRHTSKQRLSLEFRNGVYEFAVGGDVSRREAVHSMWNLLKRLPDDELLAAVERMEHAAGERAGTDVSDGLMLTREHVERMPEHLMEIGSHTLTHPQLAQLSPSRVEHELRHSRLEIERHLRRAVHGFSYPSASFEPWMTELAKGASYRYACLVGGKTNPCPPSNLFELHRIHVQDWPLPVFKAEIGPFGGMMRSVAGLLH